MRIRTSIPKTALSILQTLTLRVFAPMCLFLGIAPIRLVAQVPPQEHVVFDSARSTTEDVYIVRITPDRYWLASTDYERCGIADAQFKIVVPVTYRGIQLLHEGLLAACIVDGKCGYIDVNGKELLPFIYKNAGSFSDGMAFVTDSTGQKIFIDHNGKKKFDAPYDNCDEFSEGRAIVFKGGGRGYIDHRGKLVVPIRYKEAERFKNNRARVRLGDDYFIINRRGKIKAKAGHWTSPPYD